MRPDERRGVIPLHGAAAPGDAAGYSEEERGPWEPARIVESAPLKLRPLIVDLLGAMGVGEETLGALSQRLPDREAGEFSPEEMGAAVSIVRTAVEQAAVGGAAVELTRTRHACLDAASIAWAEAALDRRSVGQRRLLRDVSHDIRSPLNSILFLADALRSGHSGELTPEQKRQVDVLFMAAVTLVKLVNDLIDYAHLDDTGEITVAERAFTPASVVEDVQGLLGPLLDYHEVELTVNRSCDAPRRGDARLLNRVLLNLLSNATQAMAEGGRVHLTLADGADGSLEVCVADEGPGIDVEEVRKTIAAALAGVSLAETEGWTHGLGLSITARLVDAAGGQLEVEANEPTGTRFRVRLPFAAL